jgi:hypothetical protein
MGLLTIRCQSGDRTGVFGNGRGRNDFRCDMSTPDRRGLDIEAILNDLYASEINASISWLWDGRIDVKLGDPMNGYKAEDKVSTFAEAAAWLRDQACTHYPDSEFAHKYGGFV